MAEYVRVEFTVKDVNPPPRKPRRKFGGNYDRASTRVDQRPASASNPPTAKPEEPGPVVQKPYPTKKSVSFQSITNLLEPKHAAPAAAAPSMQVPEVDDSPRKGSYHLPPKSGRPKTAGAVRSAENNRPWNFTSKELDRDTMQIEQDLCISSYRARHPDLYDDDPRHETVPSFSKHHPLKGIPQRGRILPQTSGNVVNNPFPQYPFLNSNPNGIHPCRWNITTVDKDDPERCKPVLHAPGKSQEDFHRSFHTISRGSSRIPQDDLNRSANIHKFKDMDGIVDL